MKRPAPFRAAEKRKKTASVSYALPKAEKEDLKRMAEACDVGLSEFVRTAVRYFAEAHDLTPTEEAGDDQ